MSPRPANVAALPRAVRVASRFVPRVLAGIAAIAALAVPGCAPPPARIEPLSIVVACGPFADPETAAGAYARIDWWDTEPGPDDACTEAFAAIELRRHLARALRVPERSIALRPATTLPPAGDVFVLGTRRSNPLVAALARRRPTLPAPAGEGFGLRAVGDRGRSLFVIEGGSRAGTLYGVYALLERMGVHFDGLGEAGTIVPADAPPLPRRLRVREEPAFVLRGFWAWEPRGNPEFFLWMARNRMNLWTAAEPEPAALARLGIRLAGGGHSLQSDLLSPRAPDPGAPGRTYFQSHPEWFGLQGNRRSDRLAGESGVNFCTSSPGAVHELATGLIASLARGPLRHADLVNVWPLDGGRWCECAACRAIGGPTERLLDLLARLDAELVAARRDGRLAREVELAGPAYLETQAPPRRVPAGLDTARTWVTFFPYVRCYAHGLFDPTCTEINARIATRLRGWAETNGHPTLGVGEYYNVSWFRSLPLFVPHVMAEDIRGYAALGLRRFHYMHAPTRLWGTWSVQHALLARLLWSPSADVDSLLEALVRRDYPGTHDQVARSLAALERATANLLAILHAVGAFAYGGTPGGRLTAPGASLLPLRHLPFDVRHGPPDDAPTWVESMDAMRAARAALDEALAACRDPVERARLEDAAGRLAYGGTTYALYDHLLRAAASHRAGDRAAVSRELAGADSAAARLRGMRDLVQVAASHTNARDALEASHVAPTLAWFRERYGAGRGGAR